MKKILLSWSGMASQQVSGGDVYTQKLIECINPKDTLIDIILTGRAEEMLNKAQPNIRSVKVLDNHIARSIVALVVIYIRRAVLSIIYILRRAKDFDIAIASSPFAYDILPVILSKSRKRAVVIFHILPERKAQNFAAQMRFFLASLEQSISLFLIGKYFDTLLVGNDLLQSQLQERFPNKTIYVSHAGINTTKIDLLTKTQVVRKPEQALFVGRLTQQKGILDIIQCAKALQSKKPNFRLVVIGDGQDRELFVSEIKSQGITNIEMLGYVSEEEKYKSMKESKFFIFPSYEEGWGIALAEALYCGCLAVTYELPHYRSLFEEFPLYVTPGDKAKVANTIIDHYLDTPSPLQVEAMHRYDDVVVINDVLKSIEL